MKKIFISLLALVFAGCGLLSEKIETSEEYLNNLKAIDPTSVSFKMDPQFGIYYGTLTLTGYLNIETRICKELDPCIETVDYASLIVMDADNEDINQFLVNYDGNYYAGGNKVGLGCYQKDQNRIFSVNIGNNRLETSISGEQLTKLLSSTETNPVSLKLTSPVRLDERGGSECYSYFRNFEVL
ncbi:MAG: hypothetical protein WC269_03940 [Candidatus Gracilibacteria bacterium]|jgi:hypothetical protein